MAVWTCNRCGTSMQGRGIANHYASKRCTDIVKAYQRGKWDGHEEGWKAACEEFTSKLEKMTEE